ncbi:hypothetical protein AHAS_Ahas20G0184800 [Arachis hypogaea]
MEGGRPRKKEESLFALLRPVSVRGVTVVAAVKGCVIEPLSPDSAASPGSTATVSGRIIEVYRQLCDASNTVHLLLVYYLMKPSLAPK